MCMLTMCVEIGCICELTSMLIEQCVALSCDRAVASRRASKGVQANLRLHKNTNLHGFQC